MPKRSLPNRSLIDQLDQAITQLLATPVVTVQSADPELVPLLHLAAELRQLTRGRNQTPSEILLREGREER